MVNKVKSIEEAAEMIKDNSSLLIAGFYYCGRPETILKVLHNKNVKSLSCIVNDIAFPNDGVGQLVMNDQVKEVTISFLGSNHEINQKVAELVKENKLKVNVVPQGTLIEKIRAGGFGLGGILTPTGVGTIVEEGKQIIEINGKKYLLETAMKADFGLIRAYKADQFGNLIYRRAARNFNPYIAAAGNYTIAEAEIISEKPLNPELIHTPGIFVNAVVQAKKHKIRR